MSGAESAGLVRVADVVRDDSRFDGSYQTEFREDVLEIHSGSALVVAVVFDGPHTVSRIEPYLGRLNDRSAALLIVGDVDERMLSAMPEKMLAAAISDPPRVNQVTLAILGLVERIRTFADDRRLTAALDRARYELRELTEIGRAITQERDLTKLLGLILVKSRYVTGADAGSIYVVEPARDGGAGFLRFKLSQNDSVQFESKEFTLPISTRSISGYAAVTRAPINIAVPRATRVKPLRSIRESTSPTRPRATPSGLTRTRVRSDTAGLRSGRGWTRGCGPAAAGRSSWSGPAPSRSSPSPTGCWRRPRTTRRPRTSPSWPTPCARRRRCSRSA